MRKWRFWEGHPYKEPEKMAEPVQEEPKEPTPDVVVEFLASLPALIEETRTLTFQEHADDKVAWQCRAIREGALLTVETRRLGASNTAEIGWRSIGEIKVKPGHPPMDGILYWCDLDHRIHAVWPWGGVSPKPRVIGRVLRGSRRDLQTIGIQEEFSVASLRYLLKARGGAVMDMPFFAVDDEITLEGIALPFLAPCGKGDELKDAIVKALKRE